MEDIMGWKDLLFLMALVAIAGVILYRALRNKKWCPAIYGSPDEDGGKGDSSSESGD
jgi:hypothetical protein